MTAEVVLCSDGHKMSELCVEGLNADNFTYSCDMCLRSIIQKQLPYTCGECSYYLCSYCVESAKAVQFTQQNEMKSQLISKSKPKHKIPKVDH